MPAQVTEAENLRLAFARVEASRGMAGVDGVTIAEYRHNLEGNLAILAEDLRSGRYEPLPLLRLLVAKRDGSPRALAAPAVRDRVAQAAVLNVTEPLFEAQFEEVSFAYRKGRSVKLAARRIQELHREGFHYIVDADVDDFFDTIDHELLLEKVARVVEDNSVTGLIRLWVKAEIYDGEKVYTMEKGIPQGAVISPLLANLFLDELDEALLARGHQIVRYADDFVILAKSRGEAEAALELTAEILRGMRLALDLTDTEITDFDRGLKYLGLIFVGESIFMPFDRPRQKRQVLFRPPPFDLAGYLSRKRQGPKPQ